MTIIPQNITGWEDSNIVHNAELYDPQEPYGVVILQELINMFIVQL